MMQNSIGLRSADLTAEAGDIKYVWEKSRFSYILTIIRYDYHFEHDLSEFVFEEIDSWIQANPINQGPNWRCSQEISLRIFNWCYALYYYQNAHALTEERWQKIQQVIYASLHHVYHHIDFSRIAVRNNHAITETLFLALSNILFPFIPETKRWSKDGVKWLEKEIDYQIYDDGTFLQFSMNYHRVVVQLLSLGISIFEKNKRQFSDVVYQKAYKSVNFLYQCMQDQNGWLPNYGSNDGALFFPLTDADYRDYRPQLNTLHQILTGKSLSMNDEIREDYHWVGGEIKKEHFQPIVKKQGIQSFDIGGYYLCRVGDLFTFIRCGNHKDRPAQADNLHIDIWYKGENVLRDSGTYQYNTSPEKLNYFMGTTSHNTVMVGEHSQMQKGGRFIWYFWSQKREASWKETEDAFVFTGTISAFRQLNHQALHKRILKINKHKPVWMVRDIINGLDSHRKKQIWHPNNLKLKISCNDQQPTFFDSLNSDYYGLLELKQSLSFEFDKSIETKIELIFR
ncbi:alginate lyase family protein [Nitritalea halalkaliphila]|nr:alginate lyase family protein [Nitritalea halalkaliphila]